MGGYKNRLSIRSLQARVSYTNQLKILTSLCKIRWLSASPTAQSVFRGPIQIFQGSLVWLVSSWIWKCLASQLYWISPSISSALPTRSGSFSKARWSQSSSAIHDLISRLFHIFATFSTKQQKWLRDFGREFGARRVNVNRVNLFWRLIYKYLFDDYVCACVTCVTHGTKCTENKLANKNWRNPTLSEIIGLNWLKILKSRKWI